MAPTGPTHYHPALRIVDQAKDRGGDRPGVPRRDKHGRRAATNAFRDPADPCRHNRQPRRLRLAKDRPLPFLCTVASDDARVYEQMCSF